MAQERESREMAEFFKFTKVGQSIVGWIETFGQGGQYGTKYALFEPVLIRENESAPLRRFGSVAIGLSADLLSKLNINRDAQKYFGIKYIDNQPSGKGSPKKVFRVMQLEEREYLKLQEQASVEFEGVPYKAEEQPGDAPEEFDDDLGF
jgi:hypothetical protein